MTKLVEKFEGDTPSGQKTDAEQILGSMPDFEEHMRKMCSDDVVLEGNNLGKVKAKFKELSDWYRYGDERDDLIGHIETIYSSSAEKSRQIPVSRMKTLDGMVVLKPGMTNHLCSGSLGVLKTIAQNGVMATEWFGIDESEGEGAFCAFIDRIHDESEVGADIANKRRLMPQPFAKIAPAKNDVLLFFDDQHPAMQDLLRLDYFEYERIKQQEPEKLAQYTDKEIQMFEKLIEPSSKAGKNYHMRKTPVFHHDWSAIPGGIPSTLINGICIKNNNYSDEYLDELSKLFPDATIFDGNLKILRTPNIQTAEAKTT